MKRWPRSVGHGAVILGASWTFAGCASASTPAEGAPAPADTAEPAAPTQPAAEGAGAVPAGLYTQDQATRGEGVFEDVCTECHTTSEFSGRTFQADWGRRSVYSFYRTVRSTMPDDNPGGLPDQVYLDVTAYILNMNGHTVGTAELTADSPMRDVRIDPEASGRDR